MRIFGASVVAAALLVACGGDDRRGGGGAGSDAGPMTPPCEYPAHPDVLTYGEVIPPYRWNGVLRDGEAITLDLEAFYCAPEWDAYRSLVLIVGAGWCSACPEYITQVDAMSAELEAAGALIVYLEVETADFEPATSVDAQMFVDAIIGAEALGIRAGDADNAEPNAVRSAVVQMPSGYFIRKSDMRVIADQAESIYVIDYGALAGSPDGEWEPVRPPFVANCTAADEEPYEPNDSIEAAAAIGEGEFMGGVCAEASDFYAIDIAGPWRFDLYLDTFEGDLNLRLWVGGERIGGSTQRANHDWVDYAGPAVVEVYGEDGASNVYMVALGPR
jgi:hypothetical protein